MKRQKTVSYRLQFIDITRFMASSLSNLVNNFAKGIHKLNVNTNLIIKIQRLAELSKTFATAFLNIQTLKIIQ